MTTEKPLSRHAAARKAAVDKGLCSRCKTRPIDYDRSAAKCTRCLDRSKAEHDAKRKGTKVRYPSDKHYDDPKSAKMKAKRTKTNKRGRGNRKVVSP